MKVIRSALSLGVWCVCVAGVAIYDSKSKIVETRYRPTTKDYFLNVLKSILRFPREHLHNNI